jgi:hypothetical protein
LRIGWSGWRQRQSDSSVERNSFGLKQRMAERRRSFFALSALRATVAENYPPRHAVKFPYGFWPTLRKY